MTTAQRRATKVNAFACGLVLAALLVASLLVAGSARATTTFTVNSLGDIPEQDPGDGVCNLRLFRGCTLRAAIQEANATAGADTINFNISGSGVKTIRPNSPLPEITEAVTIAGYSQPGASPNTKTVGNDAKLLVELDGSGAGADASGLVISAGANSKIKGLVIGRFARDGILIHGGQGGHVIEGNYIGTDAAGNADLGNSGNGVLLDGFCGTVSDNTIGGTTLEEGNVVAFNSLAGVAVEARPCSNPQFGSSAFGNRVLSNSIFSNEGLGIDLGGDGRTPNDRDDGDTGSNNFQNLPVITSATTSPAGTTVEGTLSSAPEQTFTIQFFSIPSGNEGKTFIGQKRVTTDARGSVSFTFSPARAVRVGHTITTTATSPGADTSEFSAPRKVV